MLNVGEKLKLQRETEYNVVSLIWVITTQERKLLAYGDQS